MNESERVDSEHGTFRRTLVKVMTTQGVALLLLWWLQATFAP